VNHLKGRQTAVPDCETLWFLLRSVFPCLNINSHITQYTTGQYSLLQDVLPLRHLEHFSLCFIKNELGITATISSKGKVHPYTGTEALYRPYDP